MTGAYLALCFGASLRGNEGFYLEGSSFIEMIKLGNSEREIEEGNGHVCAPLLGRFKTETGEDKYVAVMVNESNSGIKFRLWLERLAVLLVAERKEHIAGPAFCHLDGSMIRSHQMNSEFLRALKVVQLERPDLLPAKADVENLYGTFRSMRRGSNTRATEEEVKAPVIELVNRWRKFENKQGDRPNMSMREHYLEIKLIMKRNLSYSRAL